ncbi:MAG: ComF family protein [Thermostichales cyanobacterium SZTDM-1c_bins_54]
MGWLDWLWIPSCSLCQRPVRQGGQGCFCRDCRRQLQELRYPTWGSRVVLPGGQAVQVYAWGKYEGSLKQALRRLKYDRQPQIGRILGEWLGAAWSWGRHWSVVPIPLHPEKQKQRGYNQAELISERFCQVTGCRHLPQGLQRQRATTPQYGLTAGQRQQNLEQAFQVRAQPSFPVLLVDDIFTTGATIASACQALNQAGIPVAGAVVVARPSFVLPGQVAIDVF